jgi:peptidoglycan hydrolase CwlO-like protein
MRRIFASKQIIRTTRRSVFAILWFFALLGSVFFPNYVLASPAAEELKEDLHQQINDLQQQIDNYRANIQEIQQQGKSLKREISLLDSRTKAMSLEIERTNLAVKQTENEISDKNVAIGQAGLKLDREKDILGEYVRAVDEFDQRGGFIDIILQNENISDIFEEMNSLEDVQQKIQESMEQIQQLKVMLEQNKEFLEDKREELNQLKVLQEIQRRSLILQQSEKKDLLNQTKGQESNFQALLKKTKSDAQSIRSQLYLLEGVGVAMPLDKAYQYAKKAADLTGVRPAFLLAVLKKESSWGGNMGKGNWRQDMRSADQKAFLKICDKLNLDPDKMPVSHRAWYGYGGAIGPAQFLPTVWLSYESQIASLTGHNPPDPWDIEDSFVAAALKLAQGGANIKTSDAEWKAAQLYFAGSHWNNPTYYFYGDQVMELAGVIQEQLDIITR